MPAQEDADLLAFQKWKKRWDKNYATREEENARFETFKENLRYSLKYHSPPPSSALTLLDLLDDKADRPYVEHFGYFRLDRALYDDNDDSDDDDTFLILVPRMQKKDDGSHEFVRHENGFVAFAVQRHPRDAATVKHVPPVKRTSDATKEEDTLKRQKIGSVVAKTQGCCSVENEES